MYLISSKDNVTNFFIAYGPQVHTDDRPYADCYVDPDLITAGRRYVFWFYTTYSTADVHMRYNSERGYYTFGDQLSE